jgi:hypothetical protein
MNITFEFGQGDDKRVLNFNAEWAAGLSAAKFAEHEAHHGLTTEQYKEIHKQASDAVRKNKKAEAVVVGVVTTTDNDKIIEASPVVVEPGEPTK